MGLADKLRGLKKEDYDKANAQAGSYLGGKDGQTGTDLAQEKYKQYQAGKAGNTTATNSSSQTGTTGVPYDSNQSSSYGANQNNYGSSGTTGQQQLQYGQSSTGHQQQHYGQSPTGQQQQPQQHYNQSPTGVSNITTTTTTSSSSSSSSPSTHGHKHGESTKHPGLLAKFETGVHHLDAKIAKLPEHLQKEAHKSFQKGYEDAKKAFKHQK